MKLENTRKTENVILIKNPYELIGNLLRFSDERKSYIKSEERAKCIIIYLNFPMILLRKANVNWMELMADG